MEIIKIRLKISKWYKSLIRDDWGNITKCYWNEMAKTEIIKLRNHIDENSKLTIRR